MRHLLLVGILLVSVASVSAPAYAANSCADVIRESVHTNQPQSFKDRVKAYGREVVATRGVRLLLKDSQSHLEDTKWLGVLTKEQIGAHPGKIRRYFSAIIHYVPRKLGSWMSRESGYRFTPFSGIYNVLVRKPIEYVSQKFSNRKMEPSMLLSFSLIMAATIPVFEKIDAQYQKALVEHRHSEIVNHASDWDRLLRSDYRFHETRRALEKGKISQEEAYAQAYEMSQAYNYYFEYRDGNDTQPTVESELPLLKHKLFVHLRGVVTNGVQKMGLKEGYVVPDSAVGPLSDAQILNLFGNTHQLYLKYQIISEMVDNTELWHKVKASSKMKDLVASLTQDPFIHELYQLRDQGRITIDDLKYYIQEDAYWQSRFQDYQVLGVTRLKKENDTYINEPLTLSDIREEVLAEIATQAR